MEASGIVQELRRLAQTSATGRLDLACPQGNAWVGISGGRIVTLSVSTAHPALGMRLVSGGSLSVTDLGEALDLQRQHPQMRLGDVLVRMGLVTRQDIETVAWEQMCDDMLALLEWHDVTTNFTPLPEASVPPGGPGVEDLLSATRSRSQRLQQLVRDIGGQDTVPVLAAAGHDAPDSALRPMDWAVLVRIDGHRSLHQIAEQAGLTTLEAASILHSLVAAGIATVPETHLPSVEQRPAAWPQAPAQGQATPVVPQPTTVGNPFDDPADLLRELSELGGGVENSRRPGSH